LKGNHKLYKPKKYPGQKIRSSRPKG